MHELISSLSEEVKPALSSAAEFLSNSEFSWVLIASLGPLIWKPVRYAINRWRLHRRRQKYPHVIVCCPRKRRIENTLSTALMSAVCFVPFLFGQFLLLLFGASVGLIIRLASLPFEIAKIRSQRVRLLGQPQRTSPRQPPKPLLTSVLRKPSASSPSASYHRVVFIEHSNGTVKTENYYYNPKTEPIDSVTASLSVTPEKTRMMQTPQKNTKRIQRIQTPPPRQASKVRRMPIMSDDKENEVQAMHTTGLLSATKRKRTNNYNRNMVPYQAPMATTSLSDCMRKRRIEQDSDLGLGGGKRQNRGRISLGALTHRKRVLSSRAVLSQQEREEREQSIWKEMNRKRQKTAPVPPSAPAAAPTDAARPTLSFGSSTPTSTPGATPAPTDVSKPAVSFGGTPAAPPATVPAPSDASKPSFSFGGTPTPAAAPTPTSETQQNTAVPSTPAPSAGFSFGGTPAPSASQPAPAAPPAAVPASFSFGSNTTPAPAPPAPVPVPLPAFGGVPAPAVASGAFGAAPAQTPVSSFESAPSNGFGNAPAPAPAGFGNAPAAAPGGFGNAPAPAPAGFGNAPAAAPGGFGNAPAPAPGGFGNAPAATPGGFGNAPALAPGGFGNAPSAAPGGFGNTPVPAPGSFGNAPAAALGGFGNTPAPTPGGFGNAPAAAPGGFGSASAPGGFGSAPPAPAPAFGAGAPAAPSSGASARRRAKKGTVRRH